MTKSKDLPPLEKVQQILEEVITRGLEDDGLQSQQIQIQLEKIRK
jgi:hypothetical protein